MGCIYSLLSDKNVMYYLVIAYFVICLFFVDYPKKSNDSVSKPRLQNRKRWLESEIQHLQEELDQVSRELEEPVVPDHIRSVIRAEIREQIRRRNDD